MSPHEPGEEQEPHPGSRYSEENLGTIGEEAAKLFGALADWARDHDLGPTAAAAAGSAADAAASSASGAARAAGDAAHNAGERMRHINENIATGAAECTYCPVCRGIHYVRETSPEVRNQLAGAAASLMQAAAGFLAAAAVDHGAAHRPQRSENVERIDLDEDAEPPAPQGPPQPPPPQQPPPQQPPQPPGPAGPPR